jgi:hypothetical protein
MLRPKNVRFPPIADLPPTAASSLEEILNETAIGGAVLHLRVRKR